MKKHYILLGILVLFTILSILFPIKSYAKLTKNYGARLPYEIGTEEEIFNLKSLGDAPENIIFNLATYNMNIGGTLHIKVYSDADVYYDDNVELNNVVDNDDFIVKLKKNDIKENDSFKISFKYNRENKKDRLAIYIRDAASSNADGLFISSLESNYLESHKNYSLDYRTVSKTRNKYIPFYFGVAVLCDILFILMRKEEYNEKK